GGVISESVRESIFAELRRFFRPEFLIRIDDTLLFKPLTLNEIEQIVELLLADLQKRLDPREIKLSVSDAAMQWIARQGFDPVYGARPLRRFLQKRLETLLAKRLIAGDFAEGDEIGVDLHNGDDLAVRKVDRRAA
ncbi:MAG: type VI secretion system ATPase TssH, partial [Opitutae bacterium]|nr:type VI secretion system ATPase TssH [Opitutae bacterium]